MLQRSSLRRLCRHQQRFSTLIHPTAATGFANPDLYEKARTDYQPECIEYVLSTLDLSPRAFETEVIDILDVGAGTGKLIGAISNHIKSQVNLAAIEPVHEMRDKFKEIRPTIPVYNGSAFSMPLRSNSVRNIVVGQAFHWFATEEALQEMRRVLVPRGRITLIWNTRDRDGSALQNAIETKLDEYYGSEVPRQINHEWKKVFDSKEGKYFETLKTFHLSNTISRSLPSVLDMIMSISVISERSGGEKDQIRAEIQELIESHETVENSSASMDIPYITEVYSTQLVSAADDQTCR